MKIMRCHRDTLGRLFWEKVNEIRQENKMTWAELAEKLQVRPGHLRSMSSQEKSPRMDTVYHFAWALNVEAAALLPALHEVMR